jgi:hypothetical protein
MTCLPGSRFKLDKDLQEVRDGLAELYEKVVKDKSDKGELIRLGLKLQPRQLGTPEGGLDAAFREWIRRSTGKDIYNEVLSIDDLVAVRGEMNFLEWQAAQAKKIGAEMWSRHKGDIDAIARDEALIRTHHWLQYVGPKAHVVVKMLGGKDLWSKVATIEARHQNRRSGKQSQLQRIADQLVKISSDKELGDLQKITEAEDHIKAKSQLIEQMSELEKAGKLDAKGREDMAAEIAERGRLLNIRQNIMDQAGDAGAANVINEVRDIVRIKDDIGRRKAMGELVERISRQTGASVKDVDALVGSVEALLKDMAVVGREAATLAKEVLMIEAEEAGIRDKEFMDLIDQMTSFKEIEKGFFPIEFIDKAAAITEITNMVKEAGPTTREQLISRVGNFINGHMKHRKGRIGMESANPLMQLKSYTEGMLQTHFTNSVMRETSTHLATLGDVAKKTNSQEIAAYTKAMANSVDSWLVDRVLGTGEDGIGSNLSRLILASEAGLKLGVNPAGTVRNIGEGMFQITAELGMRWTNKLKKFEDTHHENLGISGKERLERIISGETLDLAPEIRWGEDGRKNLEVNLVNKVGRERAKLYLGVEDGFHHVINKMASTAADKASATTSFFMKHSGWTRAENFLRNKAFRAGAALELERLDRTYLSGFLDGKVPQDLIRRHGLDKDAIESGDRELILKEWAKLEKSAGTQAGYDVMYNTQFQYTNMARHALENFTVGGFKAGKVAMLFQQYPISWTTTMYLHSKALSHDVKGSGLRALKNNPHAMYLTANALAIFGAMAWNEWDRAPIKVYGFFAHPIAETIKGLNKLRSDDPRERDMALFSRGVATQFTGPASAEFADAMSYSMMQLGFNRETLGDGVANLAEYGLGLSTTQERLDRGGHKPYNLQTALVEMSPTTRNLNRFYGDYKMQDPGQFAIDLLAAVSGIRVNRAGFDKRKDEAKVDPNYRRYK